VVIIDYYQLRGMRNITYLQVRITKECVSLNYVTIEMSYGILCGSLRLKRLISGDVKLSVNRLSVTTKYRLATTREEGGRRRVGAKLFMLPGLME
jgi:hypothetical protein